MRWQGWFRRRNSRLVWLTAHWMLFVQGWLSLRSGYVKIEFSQVLVVIPQYERSEVQYAW